MIDKTIEELKQIKQTLEELQEQYNYAVEQLVIYEKALDLACRTMVVPNGYCEDIECPNMLCRDCLVDHFKNKAKEELENARKNL